MQKDHLHEMNINSSQILTMLENGKRAPVLDKIEYAFRKLEKEQSESPRKLSSIDKNRMAMKFVKINDRLSRHCKVDKDRFRSDYKNHNQSILIQDNQYDRSLTLAQKSLSLSINKIENTLRKRKDNLIMSINSSSISILER